MPTKSIGGRAAGIHISGSNTPRSAIVILEGNPLHTPVQLKSVYGRIGSTARLLYSDERMVEILRYESPLDRVFVDCPLSVPPCVACQRPSCPGVIACDDVSVAYMLSLSESLKRQGARKKRPINPQSQRLWDINFQATSQEGFEPSYSANLAPLVIRAKILQRRLNSETPLLNLQESSVPLMVNMLVHHLSLNPSFRTRFRNFEEGLHIRRSIVSAMERDHWIKFNSPEEKSGITSQIDIFHAFCCAFSGILHLSHLSSEKPQNFPEQDGWVHLPKFSDPISDMI